MITLTVACPLRGRAEYLPYYLYNIHRQSYSFERKLDVLLAVNGSTLEELHEIQRIVKKAEQKLNLNIQIAYKNDGNIVEDTRAGSRLEIYDHLARVRNFILKTVNTDLLMFLDSDIMLLDEYSLQALARQLIRIDGQVKGCHAISLLIENGHGSTNAMVYNAEKKRYYHLPYTPFQGIRECDLTGAGFLLRKPIYKSCKFGFSVIGEDEPFCREVRKACTIYQNTNVVAVHCMSLEALEQYKKDYPDIDKIVKSIFYKE